MKPGYRGTKEADRGNPAAVGRGKAAALKSANGKLNHPAEDYVERERKYAVKLEDARQVALRLSQTAAERERVLAARLHDAQQTALQMSRTAAERAQNLSEALKASQSEVSKLSQVLDAREREQGALLQEAQAKQLSISTAAAKEQQELNTRLSQAHEALAEKSHAAAKRERELQEMLEIRAQDAVRQVRTIDALTRDTAERNREIEELHARFAQAVQLFNEIQRTLLDASRIASSANDTMPMVDSRSLSIGPGQLLTLRGRDFVVHSYRLLLHRDPDPSGLENYLGELSKGVSQLEIVRRIRYSPEGMKVAADVRGIRAQLAMAFLYRTPVVGRLFEAVGDVGSLFATRRERRVFEYAVVQKLEQAQSANRETREHVLKMGQLIARFEADRLVQPPTCSETDGPDAKHRTGN